MANDARGKERPWWRRPLCALGLCPHEATSDSWACWGECVHCGNVAGRTSRLSIRAYLDHEEAQDDPFEARDALVAGAAALASAALVTAGIVWLVLSMIGL